MKALALCLLVACAGTTDAQEEESKSSKVRFGIHGNITSISLPGPEINGAQRLKDIYGTGYGGGVHFDVNFVMFSFRLSGDFLTFAPDNERYRDALSRLTGLPASQFSIDGGRINILSGTVNGKAMLLPLPLVSPYLTGGIGLALLSVDDAKIAFPGLPGYTVRGWFSSDMKTTFNLGAGVDLNVAIPLFLEVKYVWILTEGSSSTYVPVTLGITF